MGILKASNYVVQTMSENNTQTSLVWLICILAAIALAEIIITCRLLARYEKKHKIDSKRIFYSQFPAYLLGVSSVGMGELACVILLSILVIALAGYIFYLAVKRYKLKSRIFAEIKRRVIKKKNMKQGKIYIEDYYSGLGNMTSSSPFLFDHGKRRRRRKNTSSLFMFDYFEDDKSWFNKRKYKHSLSFAHISEESKNIGYW